MLSGYKYYNYLIAEYNYIEISTIFKDKIGGIKMITNNLLIKLKNNDQESIEKARNTLLSMKGKIESLKDIRVEADVRKGNYDIMLITKYDSLEGLDAYLIDPVHVEVAKYIGSVLESQASLCYESID